MVRAERAGDVGQPLIEQTATAAPIGNGSNGRGRETRAERGTLERRTDRKRFKR
jgi:hypothetical protein